jgi:hypothetical protein
MFGRTSGSGTQHLGDGHPRLRGGRVDTCAVVPREAHPSAVARHGNETLVRAAGLPIGVEERRRPGVATADGGPEGTNWPIRRRRLAGMPGVTSVDAQTVQLWNTRTENPSGARPGRSPAYAAYRRLSSSRSQTIWLQLAKVRLTTLRSRTAGNRITRKTHATFRPACFDHGLSGKWPITEWSQDIFTKPGPSSPARPIRCRS